MSDPTNPFQDRSEIMRVQDRSEIMRAMPDTNANGWPDQHATCVHCGGQNMILNAELAAEVERRVSALVEAARREERVACARLAAMAHMVPPDGGSPTEDERIVAEAAAAAIRALPPPADASAALAALVETARREAFEEAARMIEPASIGNTDLAGMALLNAAVSLRARAGETKA